MASIALRRFAQVRGPWVRSLHLGVGRRLPQVTLDTTLSKDQLPGTFATDLSAAVADTLGKKEKYVTVVVNTDALMCRDGTHEPNAVLQVWSFDVFDDERNPKYTKDLYDFLLPALNLKLDRVAMFFHPIRKGNVATLIREAAEK